MNTEFSSNLEKDRGIFGGESQQWSAIGIEEMGSVAEAVAGMIRAGDLVAFRGEMGAGKTTFIRLLARALGAKTDVVSPTFALQRIVALRPNANSADRPHELVHYDFYRMEDYREIDAIGFGFESEDAVVIVEWPDRYPGLWERAGVALEILVEPGNTRKLIGRFPTSRTRES